MTKNSFFEKLINNIGFDDYSGTVSVIRLKGVIGSMGPVKPGQLTLCSLEDTIKKAFAQPKLKAVALKINCPGGSPVQTSLIYKRIRYYADKEDIPVLSFTEDVAASGGYWLACAGDEIYADDSSILGSIGVISAGFGFQKLIEKYGIERRVYTSGESKSMLDPFKEEKAEDLKHLKDIQNSIHENFKDLVKEKRGKHLPKDTSKIFSGAFWSGRQAIDLGLADHIGEMKTVLEDKFGDKIRIKEINPEKKMRRFGFRSSPFSAHSLMDKELINSVIEVAEERHLWQRFGL